MADRDRDASDSLSDLPVDELTAYADHLGLDPNVGAPRGELLRRIRERQELLLDLDREALLDVVAWARIPVRRSASKETLAGRIAKISATRFEDLSDQGLGALARLRELTTSPGEPRASLERRLRRQEGLWSRARRLRRSIVGSVIAKVVEHAGDEQAGRYRFLPETGDSSSLKDQISEEGVVGGIARKLRGVADQYVEEKLDEIERRIDKKLDEIDGRLAEWRDREISNRLRLVQVTLVTAIVVAAISLGYDYLKRESRGETIPTEARRQVADPTPQEPAPVAIADVP